jgi:coatomer protein complex subunit epsilon
MNKQDSQIDELFDLKNAFYVGNFQQAVKEAEKVRLTDESLSTEKDLFMYRAYIAQKKFGVVLDDIPSNATNELKYVRLMAEFLSTNDEAKRASIVQDLDASMGSLNVSSPSILLVIANIYALAENYESGLKVLHNVDMKSSLEASALTIQFYLKLDRHDLAKRELKKLIDFDEDAIITQLASAWVYMATGEKLQDAFFTFQEQADKNVSTSLLLNSQALCQINQQKYDEAQSTLQEALEKDSNNPDAMVNTIVLNQHLGKPVEVTNRLISQLKDSNKNHPFVRDLQLKENEFNRIASNYHPSVSH